MFLVERDCFSGFFVDFNDERPWKFTALMVNDFSLCNPLSRYQSKVIAIPA